MFSTKRVLHVYHNELNNPNSSSVFVICENVPFGICDFFINVYAYTSKVILTETVTLKNLKH